MKKIQDIRLYKNGHSGIDNPLMNLAAHRVAMKLREKAFSLGEYDHLYLCFHTEKPSGYVVLDEEADRYFPWFRNVHIGIEQEELSTIETAQEPTDLFEQMGNVLLTLFGSETGNEEIIRYAIDEARKGPEMLMLFKEKRTAKGTATVYLRLLNNGYYLPLLTVTNVTGKELLRENLSETIDFSSIGEIQLSNKKVTVKPRKNAFTKNFKPISFEISLG